MLELREANLEDAEKEWEYIRDLPADENGFTNCNHGVEREKFMETVLPGFIDSANGINLLPGFVPETELFLWEGGEIVGLFRIRHELNETLRYGGGHIGYGIKKEFRGKGYAAKGLAMTIEKAKGIIKEDEIYMSVDIDNPVSLAVMLKNGAYIHHSDENEHYTRIKL